MAFFCIAYGAFKLTDKAEDVGLTCVAFAAVLLIAAATATAWDLLIRVAASRRTEPR